MIYLDSYHTTIGSIFDTKDIILAIKKSIIIDTDITKSLDVSQIGGIEPLYITGTTTSEENIKVFNHPLYFKDGDRKYLVTDLRLVLKRDASLSNITDSIRNVTEYNFLKSRSILNLHWLAGNASELMITLPFAGVVYSMWLSDMLAKAFVLDFNTKEVITIASSLFYQSLFMGDMDENDKQALVSHTIKMTKSDSELVFNIADKLDGITTIDAFALALKDITGSMRLRDLNLVSLLTIVRNSWFGNNSKDILGIALEHPPTWIALVFTALTERNYKNSTIAKMADILGKKNKGDEFIRSFKYMMDSSVSLSNESFNFEMLD